VSVVAIKFEDSAARADHFQKHGAEFGASSDIDYEDMARDFLNGPPPQTVLDCTRRSNGDYIRFDRATDAFAVVRADSVIKTFFKPQVAWHKFRSNLAYFQWECSK